MAEPGSDAAIAWLTQAELLAPSLLHAEVANALWKRVRRGEIVPEDAPTQLGQLAKVMRTIDETPRIPRALEMAIELHHPVYDCIYLALAETLGDEVLTADRGFLHKVASTGHARRMRSLIP